MSGRALTIGSLCSGACDGMALGLEWAGLGPVIWQVEIEEDRRANLARLWPHADRGITDVFRAAGALERVDCILATFPCKDLSSAGARAGLGGPKSSVWFGCLGIIAELRPAWVVVENVASGAANWVPHVRQGLERLGYSCLPVPIAASDCGAPHRRARVFVVANADGEKLRHEQGGGSGKNRGNTAVSPNDGARAGGALANPHRSEQHDEPEHAEVGGAPETVCDAESSGVSARGGAEETSGREVPWGANPRAHAGWPLELEVCDPVHGLPGRLGDRAASTKEIEWLGDSVVPQCAEVVGWVIRELMASKENAA